MMVLTAESLGVTDKSLLPFFCCNCGNRIGWSREEFGEGSVEVYCESCAKGQPIDDGDSE